jgi:hypothetical protein
MSSGTRGLRGARPRPYAPFRRAPRRRGGARRENCMAPLLLLAGRPFLRAKEYLLVLLDRVVAKMGTK